MCDSDRKNVRGLLAAVILAALAATVVGCNTTEGAGKDIEEAGDAIKDKARDAKD